MDEPTQAIPSAVPPFVTILLDPLQGEQLVTNIKVEARPAILWLLKWAEKQVMDGKLQVPSTLVTPQPNGGMAGVMRRAGWKV